MAKAKFIVAEKDVSEPGKIKPGRQLGKGTFRTVEFAREAMPGLRRNAGLVSFGDANKVGIFLGGKLVEG